MQIERTGAQTNYSFNSLIQRAADPETDTNQKIQILFEAFIVKSENFQNRIDNCERLLIEEQLKSRASELKSRDLELKIEKLEKDNTELKNDKEERNQKKIEKKIQKVVDEYIKHFQNKGHAQMGGAAIAGVLSIFLGPVGTAIGTTCGLGVVKSGFDAYEVEQKLRRIKADPERLAALGSNPKEVEENIKKICYGTDDALKIEGTTDFSGGFTIAGTEY